MNFIALALKHVTRDRYWSTLFSLVIFISSLGFITVHGMRTSIERALQNRIKSSIAADLAVSSRQKIDDNTLEEIQKFTEATSTSQIFEFFAMITSTNESKLVLVRAVDSNYPLYGNLLDEKNLPISVSNLDKTILIDSSLADRWGLKADDLLSLGQFTFKVFPRVVKSDSTQSFRLGNLAPRVYISLKDLVLTNSINNESTFTHSLLLKLPNDAAPIEIKADLSKRLKSLDIEISTPDEASMQLSRPIRILGDFLSVISLGSLIFSNLALFYLSRLYFHRRLPNLTIFQILGTRPSKSVLYSCFELLLISLPVMALATGISSYSIPILSEFFFKELNLSKLGSEISEPMTISALNLIFVLSVFFAPIIFKLNLPRAFASLYFSSSYQESSSLSNKIATLLISLCWLIIMAFWIAPSIRLLAIYAGSLLLLGTLAIGFSYLILHLLSRAKLPILYKLSIKRFQRTPKIFITSISIITTCSALIFITLFLSQFIRAELLGSSKDRPDLFLFDISDESKRDLLAFLSNRGIEPLGLSPLIRARILEVNSEVFEKNLTSSSLTREQETEARFRNRGLNITVRDSLSDAESLVSTLPIADSSKVPLSLDSRFASRLNLKLGDAIKLDIQGLEFEAQVTELRSIHWNSFMPNFFVQTKSGFIDEAPKIWLLGIPNLKEHVKLDFMKELSKSFPSITILDVELIINQLLNWTQDFSRILALTSLSQLVVGLFVISILSLLDIKSRESEYRLYKYLGFTPRNIANQKRFEIVSSLVASISISILFSFAISKILVTILLSR